MDPNAALAALRAQMQELSRLLAGLDVLATTHVEDAAAEVVEAFEALDGWLTGGGFLPQAWEGDTRRVVLSPGDVEDLADVLGDAYAYRNDSSDSDEELDVEGRARVDRLERRLGVNARY
jgi:hypothetical protein